MLPWLKLAIELDPQAIQTYTDTAFWLRKRLATSCDAEEVLREGMGTIPKARNPFELGGSTRKATGFGQAEHIWTAALKLWDKQTAEAKAASMLSYSELTINLARLAADTGNAQRAIQYFELAKMASPNPEAIQKQIDELQVKMGGATNAPPTLIPFPESRAVGRCVSAWSFRSPFV